MLRPVSIGFFANSFGSKIAATATNVSPALFQWNQLLRSLVGEFPLNPNTASQVLTINAKILAYIAAS
jgi:hypothetical protein